MRKLVVCDDKLKVMSESALLATCSPQERGGEAAESQQWSRAASVLGASSANLLLTNRHLSLFARGRMY